MTISPYHDHSAYAFREHALSTFAPIQDAMNARTNKKDTPDWRMNNENWSRASIQEAAEMQCHIGWAWWKNIHQPAHLNRAFMEIVDIYHFWLSDILQLISRASEEKVDLNTLEVTADITGAHQKILQKISTILAKNESKEKINAMIDLLILTAAKNSTATSISEHFANQLDEGLVMMHLIELCGKTKDDLYAWYAGKSALNLLRWDNGYDVGTYIKIWEPKTPEKDEQEDNDFLETLILHTDTARTTQAFYDKLVERYRVVSKNDAISDWKNSNSEKIVSEILGKTK